MKFFKALINSLISGFFFSGLLALLIYDLNINLPFDPAFFAQLTLFLAIIYGIFIALLLLMLFFIIQFFSSRSIKISLISPSFLTISFSFLLLLFLIIYSVNHEFFLSFFNSEIIGLLRIQSITLIVLALLSLLVFLGYHSYKKKALFWFYPLLLFVLLFFAVKQRINYPLPVKPEKAANYEATKINKKITIIGLEGLSFDFIIPLITEEKLPNFSWLMEEGSWGQLESFSPNEIFILNNSFNTGKLPAKHHQFSLFKYRLLNFTQEIEIVPRFIFFRQLMRLGLLRIFPNQSVPFTKDIWEIFEDNQTTYVKNDWPYFRNIKNPSQKIEPLFNLFYKDLKFETSDIFKIVKQAFYSDIELEDKSNQEKNRKQPQLFYVLLKGLNVAEALFYKFSFPDLFGDIDQEEINKFSSVIERYYQYYDQIIGKYLASLKEDELLIVYSPHGIEPLPLWKRFVEWILGNPEISAYHEYAPEGVVFFYGQDIVRGQNIEGMKLIDISPTILNYLGLPVGKDMDGIVQSSVFVEEFKVENPVLYISSYEEITIKPRE
ncbi:alkaline phosphatase family protein [Acidobacteriota bacterium]